MRIEVPTIVWPTYPEFESLVQEWGDRLWCMDTETDGLSVRGPDSRDRAWFVGLNPVGTATVLCFDTRSPQWIQGKRLVKEMRLLGHNLRFDLHAINLEPTLDWIDTIGILYRCLGTDKKKSLDYLAGEPHNWNKIPTPPELKGKKDEQNRIGELHKDEIALYMADDILFTSYLYSYYAPQRLTQWQKAGDPTLERTVLHMEQRGVRLLEDNLDTLSREISPLVHSKMAELRGYGFEGNPNSPQQVEVWLRGLGYKFFVTKYDKKTRARVTKWSTSNIEVLQPHIDRTGDPVILALSEWRKWNKKLRDFCQRLPDFVDRGGLIHGSIRTTGPRTLRFAQAEPNMGAIPKRGVTPLEARLAKAFRGCFTGASGWFSGADFNQVDLKCAAALSGDEYLLEAFSSGEDAHAVTAARAFGHPDPHNLPEGERFKAKAITFGILNGMRGPRLSTQLRCSLKDAEGFLDGHKDAHPALWEWMDSVTNDAQRTRVVCTLAGTYRRYGDKEFVNSAVSMKTQGNAAELLRKALVAVDAAGLRPILSVYDEIGCDIRDKGDEIAEVMRAAANNAFPADLGDVDFTAGGWSGRSWAEV